MIRQFVRPILVPLCAIAVASALAACVRVVSMSIETDIEVEGLTSASSEKTLQSTVSALPGVAHCKVDGAGKKVVVEYDPEVTNVAKIAESIRGAGYATPKVK